MAKPIPRLPAKVGYWTPLAWIGGKRGLVLCQCDCGRERLVHQQNMTRGRSRSCGCMRAVTHGFFGTATYRSWSDMKKRCFNPTHRSYKYYGARGITVCKAWMRFEAFLADMGVKPDQLTLDRKDNDGNYEPGNCRWATRSQQMRNRRDPKLWGKQHYKRRN